MLGLSSGRSASTPRGVRADRIARPVTLAPTTSTRVPWASGSNPPSGADGTEPLAVEQRNAEATGDRGEQPESDDHGGLGPSDQLEMVVEGRHSKDPAAGRPKRQYLHDDRDDL